MDAVSTRSCLVSSSPRNHFVSTHPGSFFVNRVFMRALRPDGQLNVMKCDVTVTRGGRKARSELADRGALRSRIAEHFRVDLPEVERVRVPSIPE